MKRYIRRILRSLGYGIYKIGSESPPAKDIFSWLRTDTNVRTIIDIGANNGEFGQFLADLFNVSAYYGFEPLPGFVPLIQERLSGVKNVNVFNVALSDCTGNEKFYVNSYAPASSLLRVSDISKKEFPQTSKEEEIRVKIERLDDLILADSIEKEMLIKIDVQGMEDRVINGGTAVFSAAKYVLVEMSFVPMYEKQPLFEEIHSLLVKHGLRFGGMRNQITSEKDGQPLFAHCLYARV